MPADTTADLTADQRARIVEALVCEAILYAAFNGRRAVDRVAMFVIGLDHDMTEEQVAAIAREAGIDLLD